jgi:hypothetical protein
MQLRSESKLALVGAAATAVGTVCPIITLPLIGSINYLAGGKGDGVFILGAALVGAAGAAFGTVWLASIIGIGLLAFLLSRLGTFLSMIAQSKSEIEEASQGTGFGDIGNLFSLSLNLEWGWLVLFAGALLMIWSGVEPAVKWATGKNRQASSAVPDERSAAVGAPTTGLHAGATSDVYDRAISEALKVQTIRANRLPEGGPPRAAFGKRLAKKS